MKPTPTPSKKRREATLFTSKDEGDEDFPDGLVDKDGWWDCEVDQIATSRRFFADLCSYESLHVRNILHSGLWSSTTGTWGLSPKIRNMVGYYHRG